MRRLWSMAWSTPPNTMASMVDAIATSINEAAKALSVGRTTIYALIKLGRLKTIKLGRRTLITADSVRRLVEE